MAMWVPGQGVSRDGEGWETGASLSFLNWLPACPSKPFLLGPEGLVKQLLYMLQGYLLVSLLPCSEKGCSFKAKKFR